MIGLLGLLLDAKKRGVVDAVRPILEDLLAAGFFIDGRLYRLVLIRAGE